MLQTSPNPSETVNNIFKPLGRAHNEIRLVLLQPAFVETDSIFCNLEQVKLDDNPKYSALSWAWGDADQTETIKLQGQDWQAPRNLVVALRAFRQKIEPWKTWIDALCINQSQDREAIKERGHQVQLMRAIYAKAERLFIWVGESQSWTSDFFNCMRQLAEAHRAIDQACAVIQSFGREDHNNDLVFMKWLWEFSTRAWWRRLWVLQEMVLAPDAVVVCGPHMILLDQVLAAFLTTRAASNRLKLSRADSNEMISIGALITTIEDLGIYGPSKLLDGKMTATSSYQRNPKRPNDDFTSFSLLLAACRFRLSSDPRDKIYGLLGMTSDNVASEIVPRYDKSVVQVYIETAFTLIERTRSLFILSQAQVTLWRSSRPNFSDESLPSWVPNWSAERRGLGFSVQLRCQSRHERARRFNACLQQRAVANLVTDRILKLRGIRVDSIVSLHKIWEKYNGDCFPNLSFMNEWAGKTRGPGHSDAYIAGGSRINAYWRSWVHDMLPSEGFESQDEGRTNQARRCDEEFVKKCEDWRNSFEAWQESLNKDPKKRPPFPFPSLVKESTFTSIRFLVTGDKLLGLGNATMLAGDLVYVLAGGSHPFILRPQAHHQDHYELVGECYVHGVMDGQALTEDYGSGRRRRRSGGTQNVGLLDTWEDIFLV